MERRQQNVPAQVLGIMVAILLMTVFHYADLADQADSHAKVVILAAVQQNNPATAITKPNWLQKVDQQAPTIECMPILIDPPDPVKTTFRGL